MNTKSQVQFLNTIYHKISEMGYTILFIFIDDFYLEQEINCIIIPRIKDIIFKKDFINFKLFIEDYYINITDIRIFFNKLQDQNLFYLQFFEENFIINNNYEKFIKELINLKEDIINYDKFIIINNIYYETEYIKNKLEKYYNENEQINFNYLFKLFRLRYFCNNFIKDLNYTDSLDKENILNLKQIFSSPNDYLKDILLFPVIYHNIIINLQEYVKNNKFIINYLTFKKLNKIEFEIIIKSIKEKGVINDLEF